MLLTPPENFNVTFILQQMKIDRPLSKFAQQQNEEIDRLIQMNCHKDVIGQILGCRGCQIVIEECLSNPDELRVSAKQWTANTHKLYMIITQSPAFQRDLEMFFGSNKLLPVQTTIVPFTRAIFV